MAFAQGGAIIQHDADAFIGIVAAVDPTAEAGFQEGDGDIGIAFFRQPIGIHKDMILQHGCPDIVEVDDIEVFRLVELAGVRVDGFQHLGVLVVGHGLGGVQLAIKQQGHIKGLLNDGDIIGVLGVDIHSAHGGEELMLVAKAPGADAHASEIINRLDAGIHKADLECAAALEDLGDIDQVDALLVGFEHLGHPGQAELRAARRHHLLRHNLDRAFQDGHIQAFVVVETEIDGGEITRELGLRHPLELHLDRCEMPVGAGGRHEQDKYQQQCKQSTHDLPPLMWNIQLYADGISITNQLGNGQSFGARLCAPGHVGFEHLHSFKRRIEQQDGYLGKESLDHRQREFDGRHEQNMVCVENWRTAKRIIKTDLSWFPAE